MIFKPWIWLKDWKTSQVHKNVPVDVFFVCRCRCRRLDHCAPQFKFERNCWHSALFAFQLFLLRLVFFSSFFFNLHSNIVNGCQWIVLFSSFNLFAAIYNSKNENSRKKQTQIDINSVQKNAKRMSVTINGQCVTK